MKFVNCQQDLMRVVRERMEDIIDIIITLGKDTPVKQYQPKGWKEGHFNQ